MIKLKNNCGFNNLQDVVRHLQSFPYISVVRSYPDSTAYTTTATLAMFDSIDSSDQINNYQFDSDLFSFKESKPPLTKSVQDIKSFPEFLSNQNLEAFTTVKKNSVTRPTNTRINTLNDVTPTSRQPLPIIESLNTSPIKDHFKIPDIELSIIDHNNATSNLPDSKAAVGSNLIDQINDYAVLSDVKVTKRLSNERPQEVVNEEKNHGIKLVLKSLKRSKVIAWTEEEKIRTNNIKDVNSSKNLISSLKGEHFDTNLSDLLKSNTYEPKTFEYSRFTKLLKYLIPLKDPKAITATIVKLYKLSLLVLTKFKDVSNLDKSARLELDDHLLQYLNTLFLIQYKSHRVDDTRLLKTHTLKKQLISQCLGEYLQMNDDFKLVLMKIIKDIIIYYIDSRGIIEEHLYKNPKAAYIQRYISEISKNETNLKLTTDNDTLLKLFSKDKELKIFINDFRIVLNLLLICNDGLLFKLVHNDIILKLATRIMLHRK